MIDLDRYTKEQLLELAKYGRIEGRSAFLLGEALCNTCGQKTIDKVMIEHMFLCESDKDMEGLRCVYQNMISKKTKV